MSGILEKYEKIKILIIDDDPTSNILLKNILIKYGINNILCITDSHQASEVFSKFEPDLIFLDLEMPVFNGLQVLSKLQKANKKPMLSVIMISIKNDQRSRNCALALGIDYFIQKPFDKNELFAVLQNTLNKKMLLDEAEKRKIISEAEIQSKQNQIVDMEHLSIERLLLTIKARDIETGEHVKRISALVYELSKKLDLDERLSIKFAEASKLHDIGKIGIPDSILLKDNMLDETEWEMMKTHTLIGETILSVSKSEILRTASIIAKTHHENWNGTGYPEGLAYNEIPLEGRITAIADVFEALLSNRSYKKAWGKEKVVKYMKDESGKKFDPKIADILLENIDQFLTIYHFGNHQSEILIENK